MDGESVGDVTRLLHRWQDGHADALTELVPLVYQDLRRLAQHCLHEGQPLTLEATALVHEVYCKLARQTRAWFARGLVA